MSQMQKLTSVCKLGFLVFTLILINSCWANIVDNEVGDDPEYRMIQGVKVYQGDRECVLVGGLCVHSDDCLEPTSNKGLCSSHAHLGVECCYELPLKPAPCEQHMGICRNRCPVNLQRPGVDCIDGEVCCVLV